MNSGTGCFLKRDNVVQQCSKKKKKKMWTAAAAAAAAGVLIRRETNKSFHEKIRMILTKE